MGVRPAGEHVMKRRWTIIGASALAETLVGDARLRQGRQRHLLLPERAEVQVEICDVGFQRQGEPRRRRHLADCLRPDGIDLCGRDKDQCAREEGSELSPHGSRRTDRAPVRRPVGRRRSSSHSAFCQVTSQPTAKPGVHCAAACSEYRPHRSDTESRKSG